MAVAAPPKDPYYVAEEEVLAALQSVRAATERLKRSGSSGGRRRDDGINDGGGGRSAELLAELRQLENDVQHLETSVRAVEANPSAFPIAPAEVQKRKRSTAEHRREIDRLKAELLRSAREEKPLSSQAEREGADRRSAAAFVRRQLEQQQVMRREQDEQLDELAMSADRLHNTAIVINEELQGQQQLLSELDDDIERQTERMNVLMRNMSRLLKTSDMRKLCLILWLMGFLAFLVFLIIVT